MLTLRNFYDTMLLTMEMNCGGGDMKQSFRGNAKIYSVRLMRHEIEKFDHIMKIRNGKTDILSRMTHGSVIQRLIRNWIIDNEHSEKPFPTQPMQRLDI